MTQKKTCSFTKKQKSHKIEDLILKNHKLSKTLKGSNSNSKSDTNRKRVGLLSREKKMPGKENSYEQADMGHTMNNSRKVKQEGLWLQDELVMVWRRRETSHCRKNLSVSVQVA